MQDENRTPEEWAQLLQRNWTARSHSDLRDFYVASMPGWRDAERWAAQAEADVSTLFWGLDPERTAAWQVLELGCGVGRLVDAVLRRAAGYTGVDIADGMVEEARERHADEGRARFFHGDGLTLPEGVGDRSYELILSHAVLIHCPKDVIASILASAWEHLAPGGELRIQMLADPDDPEGVTAVEAATPSHAAATSIDDDEELQADPSVRDEYYMGHAFRFAETEPFLRATLPSARVQVIRPTLTHVYAILARPDEGPGEGR